MIYVNTDCHPLLVRAFGSYQTLIYNMLNEKFELKARTSPGYQICFAGAYPTISPVSIPHSFLFFFSLNFQKGPFLKVIASLANRLCISRCTSFLLGAAPLGCIRYTKPISCVTSSMQGLPISRSLAVFFTHCIGRFFL